MPSATPRVETANSATCPECGSDFAPRDVIQHFSLEHYQATGLAYRAYTCRNPWHAITMTARRQSQITATSGLLESEMNQAISDIYDRGKGSRQMVAEVQRMIERPFGMLTLWGGPGNGKTLALQVLVNTFLSRGQPAIYVRLSDLLDHLRDGYEPGARIDTGERYQQLAACKFLAIDEFDKPRMTDYAREVTFTLMDDRYRYGRVIGALGRHTAIAMNTDPDYLPSYLISRLRSDLHGPDGFRIIHNADPDARESGL